MRGCRCSLVRPRRAPDPPAKERERLRELRELRVKRIHAGQLKARFASAWDTWPNRLVLRRSQTLQSENETNDPLKSDPALAGPAGPATPPLHIADAGRTLAEDCLAPPID